MRIGIGAVVKNEFPYLLEWIAYHLTIGVTDFFIANNDSDDGTAELLADLEAAGWIRTLDVPGKAKQLVAYEAIIKRFGAEVDWLALIDADEFIAPSRGTVADMIVSCASSDNVGGVVLNWACYGSSGAARQKPGLVMERFWQRAEQSWGPNGHYKTVLRPSLFDRFTNPHHIALRNEAVSVTSDGKPVRTGVNLGLSDQVIWQAGRINHFVVKSREEFVTRKQARGMVSSGGRRPDDFFDSHDRNDVDDPIPSEIIRATKQKIALIKKSMPLTRRVLSMFSSW